MKVDFDINGCLTVEGENNTDYAALKQWASDFSGGKTPLFVKWKVGGPDGFGAAVDVRQLFKANQ